MTTIVWFRQDLRLADNPALAAALKCGDAVVPVFIYAPEEEGAWAPGGASRWWLHHSLLALQEALSKRGSELIVHRSTDSLGTLTQIAKSHAAARVYWNRRYEPAAIQRDTTIKAALQARGIEAQSFNGALLFEPWEVRNKADKPFQVFTPYWRHCQGLPEPPEPIAAPKKIPAPAKSQKGLELESLELLPRIDWAGGMRKAWRVGSSGAEHALKVFLDNAYADYGSARDRPGVEGTSRLSPHLHFGELSPRQVWHGLKRHALALGQHTSWKRSQFLTEIGWREFAHHLLFHFPKTPEQPLREQYSRFPWQHSKDALHAWQKGLTGYPIVDAGMRQLWRTGWMHNRVRMIVGSFLVKDLLLPWNEGARWFWDTLVDADLASNTMGWQWVAGSGADAAPYFRIFNPVTQATRFDPKGTYIREWVPELARLPDQWIHQPWDAPPATLEQAKVKLGNNYPGPMVEHALARQRALEALARIGK
jgi:deoxyribodipyrimidine photo-lyase